MTRLSPVATAGVTWSQYSSAPQDTHGCSSQAPKVLYQWYLSPFFPDALCFHQKTEKPSNLVQSNTDYQRLCFNGTLAGLEHVLFHRVIWISCDSKLIEFCTSGWSHETGPNNSTVVRWNIKVYSTCIRTQTWNQTVYCSANPPSSVQIMKILSF